MKNLRRYSKKEEIANSLTHGLGAIFGITALIILLIYSIRAKDILSIIAFSIYGFCLILMYLSSTLYHSISNKKAKEILRVFDHSSIFLFIAGTYTPVALLSLEGSLRVGIMIAIWSIAIIGVIFKIFTAGKFDKYKAISLIIYIAMGWLAIFTFRPIVRMTSLKFMLWILGGGLTYTLGTIFYSNKKIPYNHAIWHLFVLGGTVLHFIGILIHLL
ncbi:PAQR family membrane homeostasis protein TrhA [Tepidimicrobium xylanilyticum]|uniref:Hemolysin III n=1 Tax=Tepidimicrobium xylanilyticum TaxID=1123352 RepID=A0A1H2ZAP3_9FIRM|nr:hemolysin III family protein [Tepidimicrobium xylanilyticum]GMG96419.1 hemolysin III [Tepidimicrobium xylanilyticum]SDX13849.1 hemolysin III [Tepidimicrobium xylanilyticum]